MTPTAQDVARQHKRWNTGSTALALYKHGWQFSLPPKHFLCSTLSCSCSGQLGHTGKTYSVTTWGARHQQQRQQHHHQQQQQQQQQWWRRRWRRQRRGLHESFICASAAAAATAVALAGVGRIRDEQRAAWLASLRSRPHPHSIFGRPSGRPQRFVHVPDFKSWGPIYKISYNLSYDYRKSIVRSTYDSDLKRAEISLGNIVSQFTNTIADDITILHVNLTLKSFPFIVRCCVNYTSVVS